MLTAYFLTRYYNLQQIVSVFADDCITTLLKYESQSVGSHVDIRHEWMFQNFLVYMYVNSYYFPMFLNWNWSFTSNIISLTWN